MDLQEKILREEIFNESPPFTFCGVDVELPNKKVIRRVLVKHPGSVAVLAVDDANRYAMVEQYRYAVGETLLEVPAGKLDRKTGESPEAGARRELEEETGFTADEWIPLGKMYPSPGIIDEVMYLFVARKLKKTAQNLDEDEFINLRWLTHTELSDRIAGGTIADGKTICVYTLALLRGLIPAGK
jgi:ADP-ribose pyrophosphatase